MQVKSLKKNFLEFCEVNKLEKNLQQLKIIELLTDFLKPKKVFTTSYNTYIQRTKSSFDLLNSIKGKNMYKIYPHELFCNNQIKNRCMTHDNEHIFYWDDDHTSLQGSKMINDLILKEIKKIEMDFNKSN